MQTQTTSEGTRRRTPRFLPSNRTPATVRSGTNSPFEGCQEPIRQVALLGSSVKHRSKCLPRRVRELHEMAQKVVVALVDDLTGDQADETISFGVDGKNYEIDLSTANAKNLRESLARYVEAARRPGRTRRSSGRAGSAPSGRPAGDREQNQAIREWARKRGMQVNERGRIPADVVQAYRQEN